MSEQGWPLLGDTLYGGPKSHCQAEIDRPLLHATTLAFHHPVTDKFMEFSAELPTDFLQMLKLLKLDQDKES
jgi:23S rRNA pseudouridine1911/1915/1917 synthase